MIRQEDIIKPLVFLDIFDYPPTAMEIWRFLSVPAELGEIVPLLSKEGLGVVKKKISPTTEPPPNPSLERRGDNHPRTPPWKGGGNGFYFLPGREALLEKRRDFFHLSEKKFKIAKRAAWFLRFIPSIKMIAVCNNFYYREQSDVDFFIITSPKRLWMTRFFATVVLDIFGLRARGEKTADKVCLSFYLSEEDMNLEKIMLKEETDPSRGARDDKKKKDDKKREAQDCFVAAAPRNDKVDDPYLAYWLAFLEPIYGQECYNKFWEANAWLKNIFPNAWPKMPVPRRCIGGILSQSRVADYGVATTLLNHPQTLLEKEGGRAAPNLFLRRRGNALGDWLELIAKKIQWWKIPQHVKEMSALGDSRVVINEAMLKFHENDRREFFREEFKKKIIKNV